MNPVGERLKTELETFEAKKQELLTAGLDGKYVLIQGTSVVNTFDTYGDVLKVAYEKFGVETPFLIKQISGLDRVQFFTRSIAPCQS